MELYYAERGNREGPSIVFIHGGGLAGWMWEKQAACMKDYHCIIPDLPEHGKSADIGPLSIQDCTARISRLIEEKANGGKAHVIGHSLGGKIVVDLLASRPDLILSAIAASALFRPVKMMVAMHKPWVYRMTVAMLRSKTVMNMTARNFKFPDETSRDNCIRDFRKLTADSLYREYDALYSNLELPAGLEKVNVPTLALAGEREFKAMKQSVIDIATAMPNARGAIVLKNDHTYPWSMSEGFSRLAYEWITEQKATGERIKPVGR